jgi:hypothetical protein
MAKYYSTTLQKGSKGDEVKEWQQFLKSQGYNLDVDGDFGDITYNLTGEWQRKNGLVDDGIVGKDTWGKAGYMAAPSTQGWSYKDFQYEGFKEPEKFTYDDYKESDAVKGASDALNTHLAYKPGKYYSQWQNQLDELMNSIMNRDKFSYDLNGDALYQQYKDKYIQQGKLAMGDAIGQASAMTGGYGNSYAQSVGQQAYQAQLDNLNDIVPELYAMALDQYNREGQDLYNQYGLVMDRENFDYGRYRDKVSDFLTERDYLQGRYDSERGFDYGKYVDDRNFAYGQYADDRNFDYSKYSADRSLAYDKYATDKNLSYEEYRAAIADEQWQKEYDESVRQYNEQMAFNKQKYNDSKVSNQTTVKNPTKEPEKEPEDVTPVSGYTGNNYSEAVTYCEEHGVPSAHAAGIMTQSEWAKRKNSGSNSAEVKNYNSYKDYLAAITEYLIEQYN